MAAFGHQETVANFSRSRFRSVAHRLKYTYSGPCVVQRTRRECAPHRTCPSLT